MTSDNWRDTEQWADTVTPEPEVHRIRVGDLVGARVRYWALRFRCDKWPCELCPDECVRVRGAMVAATDWQGLTDE